MAKSNMSNMSNKPNKLNTLGKCIIPIFTAFFNVIIILFPQAALNSAKSGLLLWFNRVVPSLLPFLIGTGLLNSLGFCSFLGVLFAPLMNKVFKIKGEGAYALAIGMTSGCPLGAKTACELRQNGILDKNEAQRLLGFVNNSGPLFVLGTAASSMLLCPKAGYLMLFIQYLSAFITGLFLRLFSKTHKKKTVKKPSLKAAFSAMIDYRQNHPDPFGKILSDSIKSSVETILQIGGFIILFSVLSEILSLIVFRLTSSSYIIGSVSGVLEVTNGCAVLSRERTALSAVLMTAFISWAGLSIHAQSIAVISKTDLSPLLYVLSKLVHGIIALVLGLLLMPVFKGLLSSEAALSAFNPSKPELFAYGSSPLKLLELSAAGFCRLTVCLALLPVLLMAAAKLFSLLKRLIDRIFQ